MSKLLRENQKFHFKIPTFRVLALILGSNADLPDGVLRPRIDQVFATDELAYLDLYNYWIRIKQDGYYPGDYELIMKRLIDKLKISDSLNPFVTEPKRPLYPSVWKREFEKRDRDSSAR